MQVRGIITALLLVATPAGAQRLEALEHRLPNGMQVLLLPDHTLPVVTFYSFFHVGSRNEVQGITGISHLFEHMMFNGAKKYGAEMFDRTLEMAGGFSNASTWNDKTIYYENFPSDALPLVLDLELDRLQSLNLTAESMGHELGVVKEERRGSVDNSNEGRCYEQLFATAFNAHSYHWPIVGWMADLDSMKVQSCRDYFHTYYAPNNCTVVLSGDFDPALALKQVEATLGTLKPADPPHRVPTPEAPQIGERRAEIHKPGEVALLFVGYKGPDCKSPDLPALSLLDRILSSGESSRLYRSLVAESQVALDAGADFSWFLDPGLLVLNVTVKPGRSTAQAESLLYAEIGKLQDSPVSERELEKVKNGREASFLRGLKTTEDRAYQVGNFQLLQGDWHRANDWVSRCRAVTAADIQRVAKKYFDPMQRTAVTLVPLAAAESGASSEGAGK